MAKAMTKTMIAKVARLKEELKNIQLRQDEIGDELKRERRFNKRIALTQERIALTRRSEKVGGDITELTK